MSGRPWQPDARRALLASLPDPGPVTWCGRIHKVLGPMVEATGLAASIGQSCTIHVRSAPPIEAEVVGFRDRMTLLMPVGRTLGIAPGDAVEHHGQPPSIRVGPHLLGRVLDARGRPIDGRPLPGGGMRRLLHAEPPNPFERHRITQPMQLGVRAIDACLPAGWGQRLGLFAGAGVGKSSLLGMIARHADADVHVIALVGERSREVREFLDTAIGEEALQRCIVVVATSDMPPVLRIRAALMATAIAEHFRDKGQRVLLMMDSLTRFAQAQREIGLMLGEPPAAKGYTPSCFARLAELLERAGPGTGQGDISAIYTVLVEGDDVQADPVADAAMAVLDGHIALDRRLAERGHFPAINLLASVSRLATQLLDARQLEAVRHFRRALALYERMEDMVHLGAYEAGSNPELDRILLHLPRIQAFLQQQVEESCPRDESARRLLELVAMLNAHGGQDESQGRRTSHPTG